jgi:hypothetical protein
MTLYLIWPASRAAEAGAIGMIVSLMLGLILIPFGKTKTAK